MKNLRKIIQEYLKAIHPRVYFQIAPSNAQYPYITYDISSISADGEGMERVVIDIDGWDLPSNGDSTTLETLMENINSINKAILRGNNIQAVLYLDTKLAPIDDDKRIIRRRYTYEAKVFGADIESAWKDYGKLTWEKLYWKDYGKLTWEKL